MKVTVEIDSKWATIIRSPIYAIASAMTGVSVTFAPLFLYWCGQGKFSLASQRIVVPLCAVVIYFVPLLYFRLGNAVAKELRRPAK